MRHHRTRPWHVLVFFALFVSPAAHGVIPPPAPYRENAALGGDFKQIPAPEVAQNHAWGYSVPKEGKFEYCMAKWGSQFNDEPNDTITQGCEDWGETVKDTYRALGVLQDERKMNATFGSKDALGSIMAGAISAARINVSEYVIEGETNIRYWRDEIDKLENQLIANRSISDGGLVAGAVLCGVFPYVCVPSMLVSQLVQLGFEFPTHAIGKELDNLLRKHREYINPYLTKKGQEANALLDFIRVTNGLDEGLIFLGKVLTSYVSMAIASNATKTAADVLSDLDTISRADMNAKVKMLAGMMFNDTNSPPQVQFNMMFDSAIRGLLIFFSLGNVVYKAANFYGDFIWDDDEYVKALATLEDVNTRLPSILGADSDFLEEAKERFRVREDLITRIHNGKLLTEQELIELGVNNPQNDPLRIEEVPYEPNPNYRVNTEEESGSVAHESMYRLRSGMPGVANLKERIFRRAILGRFVSTPNSVTYDELKKTVELATRKIKLMEVTATKPRLFTRSRLSRFPPWAALILSAVGVVYDAFTTFAQIHEIDKYVSSAVSVINLDMKETKDVLQMWQDYHNSLRDFKVDS